MQHLKVFVWRPFGDSLGHCSLSLADTAYISWCPDGECSAENPSASAQPHNDFQQDAVAENEDNPPTYYIKVNNEQIQKIKDWWQDFKTKEKYHIIDNNCSTVVYNALKMAFPSVDCLKGKINMWVPVAIQKLAEYLVAEEHDFPKRADDIAAAASKEALEIAARSNRISMEQVRKVLGKPSEVGPIKKGVKKEPRSETNKKEEMTSWETCLGMVDETKKMDQAKYLLSIEILPNQSQLELACNSFGRCSEIFLAICGAISEYIKTKSDQIIHVWAAYKCSEYVRNDKIKIVFVVYTKTGTAEITVGDYDIYERGISNYSIESEKVLKEEENDLKNGDILDDPDLNALERCVSENADTLMDNHKNLNIVSPSVKKSKYFGTDNAVIYNQLCIALYVHVKGLIPVDEKPFPTEIGKFPTDVLEGCFTPFNGGPYVYHDQLKMGLAIHANAKSNCGDLQVGTLGGFLEHPSLGVCGLTCAHVVLSDYEMLQLKTQGCLNFSGCIKEVFQPVDHRSKAFGRLVSAQYREGGDGLSGLEVAIFQISDRLPTSGFFPAANNYEDAGFDDHEPMIYNTGKVCEVSNIRRRAEVYKYGISTEVTRGSLGFRGSVVRTTEMFGQCPVFSYRLHNQIEVRSIDGKCFALPGDSGALVFFDDKSDDSVAIGIVEGGQNNGKVFVTPICDILSSIGCPLTMKTFPLNCSVSPDSGISDSMECEDSELMEIS